MYEQRRFENRYLKVPDDSKIVPRCFLVNANIAHFRPASDTAVPQQLIGKQKDFLSKISTSRPTTVFNFEINFFETTRKSFKNRALGIPPQVLIIRPPNRFTPGESQSCLTWAH